MEISLDPEFFSSAYRLGGNDSNRVLRAVELFQKDPENTGLNLEKLAVSTARKRLWTIRASRDLRVLLAREGRAAVLLRAGHHDEIYDFAKRVAFITPVAGPPSLIRIKSAGLDAPSPPVASAPPTGPAPAAVFDSGTTILEHWTTGELAQAGFNKNEIALLRRATKDTLLDVWPDIGEKRFDKVVECCEKSPEDYLQRSLIAADEASNQRFRDAIVERGALAGLSPLLKPTEFKRLLSAPIEDWMIFLHPDQRTLVGRHFRGPARVRGAAGTGKTVVALHRAAVLAKRFASEDDRRPSILFTTFISSLPPVFKSLYERLPTAVKGAVEFVNIDKLAYRLCAQAGQRPRLDPSAATNAYSQAFNIVVRPGTPLHRAGLTPRYLRDEVTAVIKGRGVDSLDEYQRLERTGRRTPFTAMMREQAWALREEWDKRLADAGIVDFPDVVRRARDLTRRAAQPSYHAVIVDEAQDITLVGLQLIRALVSSVDEMGVKETPDALFIVGDGAQKIYPGGFTLAQAGVDVRGNSAVLRVNYRNTRQIISAAMACTGSEPVDDLGDEYVRGDAKPQTLRGGMKPCLVRAGSFGQQIAYVADQAERLCDTETLNLGDIGVCARSNQLVDQIVGGLETRGLGCQRLAEFDGHSNNLIKVGTFHRAKGMEFKITFLLGLSEGKFPAPRERESKAEYDERRALQISALFVAMTRARDGLFVLCGNEPSEVLYEALDYFDEVEA